MEKSKSMLYTIPDYYHEFTCVAGKCEDTCCAGWQIVVDDASLENYKNETGTFAERLKESVNWEEGTFKSRLGILSPRSGETIIWKCK